MNADQTEQEWPRISRMCTNRERQLNQVFRGKVHLSDPHSSALIRGQLLFHIFRRSLTFPGRGGGGGKRSPVRRSRRPITLSSAGDLLPAPLGRAYPLGRDSRIRACAELVR